MNCIICSNPTFTSKNKYKAQRTHCGNLMCRFKTLITIDDNGCWNWHKRRPNGNLIFHMGRNKGFSARRWIWSQCNNTLSENMYLLYACGNDMCVNPEHMEEKTISEISKIFSSKPRKISLDMVAYIISQHDKGWSFRDIANHFNISSTSTCHLYHKYKQYEKIQENVLIDSDEKMKSFVDTLNKEFENL